MKESRFEKIISIQGYKPLSFVGDDGNKIEMCKVIYYYEGKTENEIGLQYDELRVPYENVEKLKGKKLPLNAKVVFDIDNFNKKPNIIDFVVLG